MKERIRSNMWKKRNMKKRTLALLLSATMLFQPSVSYVSAEQVYPGEEWESYDADGTVSETVSAEAEADERDLQEAESGMQAENLAATEHAENGSGENGTLQTEDSVSGGPDSSKSENPEILLSKEEKTAGEEEQLKEEGQPGEDDQPKEDSRPEEEEQVQEEGQSKEEDQTREEDQPDEENQSEKEDQQKEDPSEEEASPEKELQTEDAAEEESERSDPDDEAVHIAVDVTNNRSQLSLDIVHPWYLDPNEEKQAAEYTANVVNYREISEDLLKKEEGMLTLGFGIRFLLRAEGDARTLDEGDYFTVQLPSGFQNLRVEKAEVTAASNEGETIVIGESRIDAAHNLLQVVFYDREKMDPWTGLAGTVDLTFECPLSCLTETESEQLMPLQEKKECTLLLPALPKEEIAEDTEKEQPEEEQPEEEQPEDEEPETEEEAVQALFLLRASVDEDETKNQILSWTDVGISKVWCDNHYENRPPTEAFASCLQLYYAEKTEEIGSVSEVPEENWHLLTEDTCAEAGMEGMPEISVVAQGVSEYRCSASVPASVYNPLEDTEKEYFWKIEENQTACGDLLADYIQEGRIDGKLYNARKTTVTIQLEVRDGDLNNETLSEDVLKGLLSLNGTAFTGGDLQASILSLTDVSVSMEPVGGTSDLYVVTLGNLPMYDCNGSEIVYSLTAAETSLGLEDGDYYAVSYENANVPGHGTSADGAYYANAIPGEGSEDGYGGTIILTRTGVAEYQAEKLWLDDASDDASDLTEEERNALREQRPDSVFWLWRYTDKDGNSFIQASQVKDAESAPLKTQGTCEDQFSITYDASVILPKYDADGYSYVYFSKEEMPNGDGGYVSQILLDGGVITEPAIYNDAIVNNIRTGAKAMTAEKVWKAAAFQAQLSDVKVTLKLQRRLLHEEGEWQDIPSEEGDKTLVEISGFSAEVISRTAEGSWPQYDEKGREYEYRWLEEGVTQEKQGDKNLLQPDQTFYLLQTDTDGVEREILYSSNCEEDPETGNYIITNSIADVLLIDVVKYWNGLTGEEALEAGYEDLEIFAKLYQNAIPYDGKTTEGKEILNGKISVDQYGEIPYHERILVPKYDADGYRYDYTVTEATSPKGWYNDGYHFEYVPKSEDNETEVYVASIYNIRDGDYDYVRVPMRKEWIDDGDEADRFPVQVAVYYKDYPVPLTLYPRDRQEQSVTDLILLNEGKALQLTAGYFWYAEAYVSLKEIYGIVRSMAEENGDDVDSIDFDSVREHIGEALSIREISAGENGQYPVVDEAGVREALGEDGARFLSRGDSSTRYLVTDNHVYETFGGTVDTSGVYEGTYTIRNLRLGLVDMEVTKTWIDHGYETDADRIQRPQVYMFLEGVESDIVITPETDGFVEKGKYEVQYGTIRLPKGETVSHAVIGVKVDTTEDSWSYEFQNMPKYDLDGVIYHYRIREYTEAEDGTLVPYEEVSGLPYASSAFCDEYQVGQNRHYLDQINTSFTNCRVDTVPVTIYKTWNDAYSQQSGTRPDIYLTLWRRTETDESLAKRKEELQTALQAGLSMEDALDTLSDTVYEYEVVPGYVNYHWNAEESDDTWNWICSFGDLPKYTSDGRLIEYFANESVSIHDPSLYDYMHTSFGNRTTGGTGSCTDMQEFDSDGIHYEAVKNGGELINTITKAITIQGKKIWNNVASGYPYGAFPEIRLTLYRVTDDAYVQAQQNGVNTDVQWWKENSDTIVPDGESGSGIAETVLTPENRVGNQFHYSFAEDRLGVPLPKYNENGQLYCYYVAEDYTLPEGAPADLIQKDNRVSDNYRITNTYEGMNYTGSLTIAKDWTGREGFIFDEEENKYPILTFLLNRYVYYVDEEGGHYDRDETFYRKGTLDCNGNPEQKLVFQKLPIYAVDGNKYYYELLEEDTSGYRMTEVTVTGIGLPMMEADCDGAEEQQSLFVLADPDSSLVGGTESEISVTNARFKNEYLADPITLKFRKEWVDFKGLFAMHPDEEGFIEEFQEHLTLLRSAVTEDSSSIDWVEIPNDKWRLSMPEVDDQEQSLTAWTFTIEDADLSDSFVFTRVAPNGVTWTYRLIEKTALEGYGQNQTEVETTTTEDPSVTEYMMEKDGEPLKNVSFKEAEAMKLWSDGGDPYGVRPSEVTVKLQVKEASETEWIDAEEYFVGERSLPEDICEKFTVKLSSKTGWKCSVRVPAYLWQDEVQKALEYRYIETYVGNQPMHLEAGTAESLNPTYVTEENSYYKAGQVTTTASVSGGWEKTTTQITNGLNKTVQLVITKKWEDNDNLYATRPTTINLIIQRRLKEESEWKNFRTRTGQQGTATEEDSKFTYTYSNLPAYEYDAEAGIFVGPYQYRALEAVKVNDIWVPLEEGGQFITSNNTVYLMHKGEAEYEEVDAKKEIDRITLTNALVTTSVKITKIWYTQTEVQRIADLVLQYRDSSSEPWKTAEKKSLTFDATTGPMECIWENVPVTAGSGKRQYRIAELNSKGNPVSGGSIAKDYFVQYVDGAYNAFYVPLTTDSETGEVIEPQPEVVKGKIVNVEKTRFFIGKTFIDVGNLPETDWPTKVKYKLYRTTDQALVGSPAGTAGVEQVTKTIDANICTGVVFKSNEFIANVTANTVDGKTVLSVAEVRNDAGDKIQLPKYDVNGKPYFYYALETAVLIGEKVIPASVYLQEYLHSSASAAEEFPQSTQVKNTLATISLTVEKKWEGEAEPAMHQDRQVRLTLWRSVEGDSAAPVKVSDEVLVLTKDTEGLSVDEDGNWSYTFTKLPKYSAQGKTYLYRVSEETLDGYARPLYEGSNGSTERIAEVTPTIEEASGNQSMTIVNTIIAFRIRKLDADTGEIPKAEDMDRDVVLTVSRKTENGYEKAFDWKLSCNSETNRYALSDLASGYEKVWIDAGSGILYGVPSGNYQVEETQVPSGYEKMKDFFFTINADGTLTSTCQTGEVKAEDEIPTVLVTNTWTEFTLRKIENEKKTEIADADLELTIRAVDHDTAAVKEVKWYHTADGYRVESDLSTVKCDRKTGLIKGLPAGDYTLEETKTPDAYVTFRPISFRMGTDGKLSLLSDGSEAQEGNIQEGNVQLSADGLTLTAVDPIVRGDAKLAKKLIDSKGESVSLSGVTFALYQVVKEPDTWTEQGREETGDDLLIAENLVTNAQGEIQIMDQTSEARYAAGVGADAGEKLNQGLRTGSYYFAETGATADSKLNTGLTSEIFIIQADRTDGSQYAQPTVPVSVEVENTPFEAKLIFEKHDFYHKEQCVEAEFILTYVPDQPEGNAVDWTKTVRVDAEGRFSVDDGSASEAICGLQKGSYTLTETAANGYEEESFYTFTFRITEADHGKTVKLTEASDFAAVRADGKEDLPLLNDNVIYNVRKSGTVSIVKKVEDTAKTINGAEFKLRVVSTDDTRVVKTEDGSCFLEQEVFVTGKAYRYAYDNEKKTACLTEDTESEEDGMIMISGLPWGEYQLVETKPADGFELADPAPTVDFTIDGENLSVLAESDGHTVLNRMTQITIAKADGGEKPTFLPGAEFALTGKMAVGAGSADAALVTYTEDAPLEFAVGEDGTVTLTGELIEGESYTLTETKAPAGYELPEAPLSFTIASDGTLVFTENEVYSGKESRRITVVDTMTAFTLQKTDSETGDAIIADRENLEMTITAFKEDGEEDGEDTADSGEKNAEAGGTYVKWYHTEDGYEVDTDIDTVSCDPESGEIRGLPSGTYTVEETKTPYEYVTVKPFGFTLGTDGTLTLSGENPAVSLSEDGLVLTAADPVVRGDAKLIKTLADTGKALQGVTFDLYQVKGEKDSWTEDGQGTDGDDLLLAKGLVTDENGEITIMGQSEKVLFSAGPDADTPLNKGLRSGCYYFAETGATADSKLDLTLTSEIFEIQPDRAEGAQYAQPTNLPTVILNNKAFEAKLYFEKHDFYHKEQCIEAEFTLTYVPEEPRGTAVGWIKRVKLDADGKLSFMGENPSESLGGLQKGSYVLKEISADGYDPESFYTYMFRITEADNGKRVELTKATGFEVKAENGEVNPALTDREANTIYNVRKSGTVLIRKEEKETHAAISGAEFALSVIETDDDRAVKDSDGAYVLEKTVFTTGKAYVYQYDAEGTALIAEDRQNAEDGRLTISGLPWGTYALTEIKPADGFALASPGPKTEFTIDGNHLLLTENLEGHTLTNQKTEITIEKTNGEGHFLPGAEFALIGRIAEQAGNAEASVKEYTEASPLKVSAGEMGRVTLTGTLIAGESYTLTETKAPAGYELPESSLTFTLASDGTLRFKEDGVYSGSAGQTISIADTMTAFTLRKADGETGAFLTDAKENLELTITAFEENADGSDTAGSGEEKAEGSGAYVKWYHTEAGYEVVSNIPTVSCDAASGEIKGLPAGRYLLEETKTPEEYVTIMPCVFEMETDGRITLTEEAASVSVRDHGLVLTAVDPVVRGDAKLVKKLQSLDGEEDTLAGVTFDLYQVTGEKDNWEDSTGERDDLRIAEALVTDADGKITIRGQEDGVLFAEGAGTDAGNNLNQGLRVGRYYFLETGATADSRLDSGLASDVFEIRADRTEGSQYAQPTAQPMVTVVNEAFEAHLTFKKQDFDHQGQNVAAAFALSYEPSAPGGNAKAWTKSVIIDQKGLLSLDGSAPSDALHGLQKGSYTLTETAATGYEPESFYTFTFEIREEEAGETLKLTETPEFTAEPVSGNTDLPLISKEENLIYNLRKSGSVSIVKKNTESDDRINGAEFALRVLSTDDARAVKGEEGYVLSDAVLVTGKAYAYRYQYEDGTAVLEEDTENAADGEIHITGLPWGVYLLVETKPADGFELADPAPTVGFTIDGENLSILAEANGHTVLNRTTQITIVKSDGEKEPTFLPGAEFALTGKMAVGAGSAEAALVTYTEDAPLVIAVGEDGTVTLTGELIEGESYTLTETKAPAGYELPEASLSFSLASDGTLVFTENGVYSGTESRKITVVDTMTAFTLEKTDSETGDAIAADRENLEMTILAAGDTSAYGMSEEQDSAYVKWYHTTDGYEVDTDIATVSCDPKSGEIQGLPSGTYTVEETKTPYEYVTVSPFSFTLGTDGTLTLSGENPAVSLSEDGLVLTVADTVVRGDAKLIKTLEDAERALEGVTFDLYQVTGEKDSWTEDGQSADGDDLLLAKDLVTDENGEITIMGQNEEVLFYAGPDAGTPLNKGLRSGCYYFAETGATADSKLDLSLTSEIFEVQPDRTEGAQYAQPTLQQTVTVINDRFEAGLTFHKKDYYTDENVAADFLLTYVPEEPAGYEEEWTKLVHTDADGQLFFEEESASEETEAMEQDILREASEALHGLKKGSYTLTEIAADSYEAFSRHTFTFRILQKDCGTVVNLTEAEEFALQSEEETAAWDAFAMDVSSNTIFNLSMSGTATILKKDAELDNPLSGAEFMLSVVETSDRRSMEALTSQVYTTGKAYIYKYDEETGRDSIEEDPEKAVSGELTIQGLPWGTYRWTEVKPAPGYRLSVPAASVTFTIDKEHLVLSADTEGHILHNEKTNIQLRKADREDTSLLLAGAEFDLVGTIVKDAGTEEMEILTYTEEEPLHFLVDEEGKAAWTGEWMAGESYTLTETAAPSHYAMLSNPISVTVQPDGTLAFALAEEEPEALIDEQGRTLTILNRKTRITVEKSEEDGNALAGAVLEILDSEGILLDQWITDAQPHVTEGILNQGETYVLREIVAPEGYHVAADVEFTVPEDGIVELSMTDTTVDPQKDLGEIQVRKMTTYAGELIALEDAVFYTALFEDEALTRRISSVQELHVQYSYQAATVFKDLEPGKTYYVAETDEHGTVLQSDDYILITISGQKQSLTEENPTGYASITNDYVELPANYLQTGGPVEVRKEVSYEGEAVQVTDTFYAALFADPDHQIRVSEVHELHLEDVSSASTFFEELALGWYYITETDAEGIPVEYEEGFAYILTVMNGELHVQEEDDHKIVTLINELKEYEIEEPAEEVTPTPALTPTAAPTETPSDAVATEDAVPIFRWLGLLLGSAGAAAVLEEERRRRRKVRR